MRHCRNPFAAARAARKSVLTQISIGCLLAGAALAVAQPADLSLSPQQAQSLVASALANELRAAQDPSHPMRYTLHKVSPRFTSTKQIVETRDGEVARLIAVFDKPLSPAAEQQEQTRLNALASNPGLQRHRKQSEDADTARALKVLRALPDAFIYQYAGPVPAPEGTLEKYTFKPNPEFTAPDLETTALSQMSGEILIDATKERVAHLEGHLDQDVDFGWGILGRLYKGGWIAIEQANVGGDQWRTVRFQMQMTGRVFFKTRTFDTIEDETGFSPVPQGLDYQKAIEMLEADQK